MSENDQFPEVEPDECVRTTEGDIFKRILNTFSLSYQHVFMTRVGQYHLCKAK